MTEKVTIERETLKKLSDWICGLPVPTRGATAWATRLSAALAAQPSRCPTCNGNDMDAPCAYPEGGQRGCLRDLRLAQYRAQPAEPVAWKHDCAGLCINDVELWIDACPHCGKPRTATAAPPAPAAVPPGYVLVPIEPTAEMITKAIYARNPELGSMLATSNSAKARGQMRQTKRMYRAMIAAAPGDAT